VDGASLDSGTETTRCLRDFLTEGPTTAPEVSSSKSRGEPPDDLVTPDVEKAPDDTGSKSRGELYRHMVTPNVNSLRNETLRM
jgi:hypothetical protein